jgi:hypothetical protein
MRSEPSIARTADGASGALRLQRRRSLGGGRQRLFAPGRGRAREEAAAAIVISAKIEAEIAVLSRDERHELSPRWG